MRTLKQAQSEISQSTPYQLYTGAGYLVNILTTLVATYCRSTKDSHWFVAAGKFIKVKRLPPSVTDRRLKVSVGSSYAQLTGIGTEYVIINDNIVAKFYEGNLAGSSIGNTEDTKC